MKEKQRKRKEEELGIWLEKNIKLKNCYLRPYVTFRIFPKLLKLINSRMCLYLNKEGERKGNP